MQGGIGDPEQRKNNGKSGKRGKAQDDKVEEKGKGQEGGRGRGRWYRRSSCRKWVGSMAMR